jgi:hypothetical protein
VISVIHVLLLIVISVAAVRSALALRACRPLFVEYQCPQSVIPLLFLFPIGLVALMVLPRLLGLLPAAVVAVAFFIPGLVALRRARYVFDRTGTDRTKAVQDSLAVAFIAGIGGVAYVLVSTFISLMLLQIRPA